MLSLDTIYSLPGYIRSVPPRGARHSVRSARPQWLWQDDPPLLRPGQEEADHGDGQGAGGQAWRQGPGPAWQPGGLHAADNKVG